MKIPIIEVLPMPMPIEELAKELKRLSEKWGSRKILDQQMSADGKYCVITLKEVEI
jgi:hypothetical protein